MFIIIFLIFCIVLFLYIHIYFHLKTSNDLEIYDIEIPNKEKFEEICNLKQPTRFNLGNKEINNFCNLTNLKNNYSMFDVNIRNLKKNTDINNSECLYLSLPLKKALDILEKDKTSSYIIESNEDFINETGLIKVFKNNDLLFKPPLNFYNMYDINIGNKGVITPLKYDLYNRNFFYVVKGNVKINLIPPKFSNNLYEIKDYENYEFISPINPWNLEEKYKNDFAKIKTLEINLKEGDVLFIPSYWWYSFNYIDNSVLTRFKYTTYMSSLSTLPQNVLHYIQLQNIKYTIINNKKKLDEKDNNDEEIKVIDNIVNNDEEITSLDNNDEN